MSTLMTILSKRTFLKSTVALTLAFVSLSARTIMAAWPSEAFEAKEVDRVIDQISGGNKAKESNQILIKVPEIAENGAVVPVTVSTDLPDVTNISIVVNNNPNPLTSSYQFNDHASPFVSTRVKMAGTSDITAYVITANDTFFAKRNIKVTIGGCGG